MVHQDGVPHGHRGGNKDNPIPTVAGIGRSDVPVLSGNGRVSKSPVGERVYGTWLDEHGVRHDASGVLDGLLAREKGGWDSITSCNKYFKAMPYQDGDLPVTCFKCWYKRLKHVEMTDILRGRTAHMAFYDEAQDFSKNVASALGLPAEYLFGTPTGAREETD